MVVTQSRAVGGINLPASPAPAGTGESVGVERHVAKLTGHVVNSTDQLPVGKHASADSFGNGDYHEVADLFPVSKPNLGKHTGVCGVLQLHAHTGRVLDCSFEVEFRPSQVGGKNDALRTRAEASGYADADALENAVRINLHQMANLGRKSFCRGVRIAGGRHGFLGEEVSIYVRNAYGRLGGAKVRYQDRAPVI